MIKETKTKLFLEDEEKNLIEDFFILIQDICNESDLICCRQDCPFQNFCSYMAKNTDEMLNNIIEMFDKIGIDVSK